MDNHTVRLKAIGLGKQVNSPAGPLTILTDIKFQALAGESVAIVGPSGSGKSTLLGLLAGLDLPTSGEVWFNGQLFSAMSEDERAALRAKYIGFVFQSFHLLPGLTALENVMLPLELAADKNAMSKASAILEAVGLAARMSHYPHKLSGGEQQRVAIARAYATQPALLFADEPTGNLDSATGQIIIELLFQLNTVHHSTLVLVTHDTAIASRCDRIVHMEAGRLEHV